MVLWFWVLFLEYWLYLCYFVTWWICCIMLLAKFVVLGITESCPKLSEEYRAKALKNCLKKKPQHRTVFDDPSFFSLFIRTGWSQTQKESKLFSGCQNLKTSKHFKKSWVCIHDIWISCHVCSQSVFCQFTHPIRQLLENVQWHWIE